ncbi:MAG: FtsQ-type POTRA domain-containing protein [Gemmatimonadetes bacterium]|nr:FtsQ-type POTRA domain-containing protein [Gemmatimonadota bacterium]
MSDEAVPAPRRFKPGWFVVAALVGLVLWTVPWWGRDLAFFRAQFVEVRGTRYARPEEIRRRLGIDSTASIWMSVDTLARRAERHPQVRSARVSRRLPGTFVVDVEENEPVAFVPGTKGLRAYDENGRLLPMDPTRVDADLPIAERPDTALLHLLADLRVELPELFARVTEVRLGGREEFRLYFDGIPVRVRRGDGAERFDGLSSVLRDLASRGVTPLELDLRFKDQVIARLP